MPLPPRLLKGARREYSIDRLVSMTPMDETMPGERRLLGLVLPPWQRREVWSVDQKCRFVEGLFLGLGSGYYVTNGLEWNRDGTVAPMAGWLLDGQQRISALRDFIGGALTVFDDVTFASLSKVEAVRFMREPFPCFELEYTNDEDALKELYNRLNFGGTPHTPEQLAL
ncbi:hypothetical protein OR214_02208 [Ralstonia pickettii OR214]|jgi:hypothetical protein|uniref:GmrSD restriction endonucleases N-terminal domain-containing protein n=3 Tax=Burkholderiaceae TaxID=119060 RepID=R0E946_RALPI|nr:hypothetical protein OR214_02208 [Ralstonia pickettii OR214]